MAAGKMLVSNPWAVIYPSYAEHAGRLVFEDLKAKRRFLLPESSYLQIISHCTRPMPISKVKEHAKAIVGSGAESLVKDMMANNALVDTRSDHWHMYLAAKRWEKHGWDDALDYWVATKDYPFLDYSDVGSRIYDNNLMKKYSSDQKPPSRYKAYRGAREVKLPGDIYTLEEFDLNKAMLLDESMRAHKNPRPISLESISELLQYPFSEIGYTIGENQGKFLLKLVPSGGSRHPVEAYVILLDSKIGKGLFHYSVKHNALEQLSVKIDQEQVYSMLYQLKQIRKKFAPKAIILMTLVFKRSMWRYREPRTYRAIHHDVGHVVETLKLICNARKLNFSFGYAMHEKAVEKYLEIDPSEESVVGFAAIG